MARELKMTVAELRRRLSTREFTQWIAFYNWEAAIKKQNAPKGGKKRK